MKLSEHLQEPQETVHAVGRLGTSDRQEMEMFTSSIEIFECCTVPNFYILGSMVCDGIPQCPDMSDECVCYFGSNNECN